jgi:hypothetical protein
MTPSRGILPAVFEFDMLVTHTDIEPALPNTQYSRPSLRLSSSRLESKNRLKMSVQKAASSHKGTFDVRDNSSDAGSDMRAPRSAYSKHYRSDLDTWYINWEASTFPSSVNFPRIVSGKGEKVTLSPC